MRNKYLLFTLLPGLWYFFLAPEQSKVRPKCHAKGRKDGGSPCIREKGELRRSLEIFHPAPCLTDMETEAWREVTEEPTRW